MVTVQDLVDEARRARTAPPGNFSRVLLVYALREVLACILAGGARHRDPGPLGVGARVLAAVIADLEDVS